MDTITITGIWVPVFLGGMFLYVITLAIVAGNAMADRARRKRQ